MEEKKILVTDVQGTPFDDAFRTLLERCRKLIIPVINEIFNTDYSMDENVDLLSNEHFIVESNGESVKRITDSCIKIRDRLYHIECESNPKTGIEIRMIEYDFHIALSNAEKDTGCITLRFPESAVFYLRHNSKTPDKLQISLIMPSGNTACYTVPVIKVQQYTRQELFDKNLLFFIPYYILKFEEKLKEYDTSKDVQKEFREEYSDIYNRLKGLEEKEYIDYNYLYELVALTAHLIETVSKNNPMVMKEVELMGGGKVIDTGSDRIYHEGLSAGISQGISQGISESIMSFLEEYGTIPDDLKARIHNEHDIDTLKKWNKLSARVSSITEFIEQIR